MAAKKFDAKAKAKRQKIILAVLGVVFLGVLAWQVPSVLKMMNKKPPVAATTPPAAVVPGTPVPPVSGTPVSATPTPGAGLDRLGPGSSGGRRPARHVRPLFEQGPVPAAGSDSRRDVLGACGRARGPQGRGDGFERHQATATTPGAGADIGPDLRQRLLRDGVEGRHVPAVRPGFRARVGLQDHREGRNLRRLARLRRGHLDPEEGQEADPREHRRQRALRPAPRLNRVTRCLRRGAELPIPPGC